MFLVRTAEAAKRCIHLGTSGLSMCGFPTPPCENASMCPMPPAGEPSPGPYAPSRTDPLLVEHDGPVTVVTINRPERRNAVDSVCADQLREAFVAFDSDDDRSVAVLTGAGGTFCAGADLKAVAEGDRRPIPDLGPGPDGADPAHAVQARHRRRRGIRRRRRD